VEAEVATLQVMDWLDRPAAVVEAVLILFLRVLELQVKEILAEQHMLEVNISAAVAVEERAQSATTE
jgi:hypothetical protein